MVALNSWACPRKAARLSLQSFWSFESLSYQKVPLYPSRSIYLSLQIYFYSEMRCAKDAEGLVPLPRLFFAVKNRSEAEPGSSLAFRFASCGRRRPSVLQYHIQS
jgi:hypothetical protein